MRREALAEAAAALLYETRPLFEAHGAEPCQFRSDVVNKPQSSRFRKTLVRLEDWCGAQSNDEGAVTKKWDHAKGVEPRGSIHAIPLLDR